MNNNNVLVASLIFSESAMLIRSGIGVNPAARRWLIGLSSGLKGNSKNVYYLGHEISSFFPKGNLFPGNKNDLMFSESSNITKYLNVWPFRWISLSYVYKKAYNKIVKNHGELSYLLSYNPWPNQIELGNYVKTKHVDVKWIMIVLDYNNAEAGFDSLINCTNNVDYYIFLSQWAYENFPKGNKYLLEGGVDPGLIENRFEYQKNRLKTHIENRKFIIFYSGMFDKWGGLELLIKAFTDIHINTDLELWICGFGNSKYIISAMKIDKRIKLFGTVSDQELNKLSLESDIFINPRPSNLSGNLMNFPSKILEYLTYCKPVISTKTPGLLDDYDKVCFLAEDNVGSLKEAIISTINLDRASLNKLSEKIIAFLRGKTWQIQLKNLFKWIEG